MRSMSSAMGQESNHRPETGNSKGRAPVVAGAARAVFLVLVCAFSAASLLAKEKPPTLYQIPLPQAPDYSSIEWLVGDWAGKTTDKKAPGEVHISVAYDLNKRFLVLHGEISLPATKTAPATEETWLGVLSASDTSGEFIFRKFSSTGFITRYIVTADGPEIHFSSAGGEQPPPGWLFRMVFQRTGPGEFTETVQTAPPSKPFFTYYTAKLTRVSQQDKTASGP